jgi:uncharacterized membrane protein
MEITVPALREISEAAALDLYTERHNYASAWWARKGRKKALRSAKKGNKTIKVPVRTKYKEAIINFLRHKGFDVWNVGRGLFFSRIRISW